MEQYNAKVRTDAEADNAALGGILARRGQRDGVSGQDGRAAACKGRSEQQRDRLDSLA